MTDFLSIEDVATQLGVTANTIKNLIKQGTAPKHLKINGNAKPKFRQIDVDEWVAARIASPIKPKKAKSDKPHWKTVEKLAKANGSKPKAVAKKKIDVAPVHEIA